MLVLSFQAARRLDCFLTCWKICERLAPTSPVLHWEGGVGTTARRRISLTNPESGRCRSARPLALGHHPPSCLPSFFPASPFSGSDKGLFALGPTLALSARGQGNKRLPAPSPGSSPPLGGGGRGAEAAGPGTGRRAEDIQTLAAASRGGLPERARSET